MMTTMVRRACRAEETVGRSYSSTGFERRV